MRKTKRQALSILIVLVLVSFCLNGCGIPAWNRWRASSALQKKYHEDFEITYYRGGLFSKYDVMMAHSESYPDLTFGLDISASGTVSDSYVTARLCRRISDQIHSNIDALDTEYYVHTTAMLPISYLTNPEITLSEYLEEGPNTFYISLFINDNDINVSDITLALLPMMDQLDELSGSVSLYFADSTLMDKAKEYVTTHDQLYWEFQEMTEAAYVGTVSFENGGFSLTEQQLLEMTKDHRNIKNP